MSECTNMNRAHLVQHFNILNFRDNFQIETRTTASPPYFYGNTLNIYIHFFNDFHTRTGILYAFLMELSYIHIENENIGAAILMA